MIEETGEICEIIKGKNVFRTDLRRDIDVGIFDDRPYDPHQEERKRIRKYYEKDLNDLIIHNKVSKEYLTDLILSNTYQGLKGTLKLKLKK